MPKKLIAILVMFVVTINLTACGGDYTNTVYPEDKRLADYVVTSSGTTECHSSLTAIYLQVGDIDPVSVAKTDEGLEIEFDGNDYDFQVGIVNGHDVFAVPPPADDGLSRLTLYDTNFGEIDSITLCNTDDQLTSSQE